MNEKKNAMHVGLWGGLLLVGGAVCVHQPVCMVLILGGTLFVAGTLVLQCWAERTAWT